MQCRRIRIIVNVQLYGLYTRMKIRSDGRQTIDISVATQGDDTVQFASLTYGRMQSARIYIEYGIVE